MPASGPDDPRPAPHTTWNDYGGGADSSQYSALKQINRANVTKLQVAWKYPTGDGGGYLFNPIVVDGVMYVLAKGGSIVALDAATGKELLGPSRTRRRGITIAGMNYWESKDRSERRLLFSSSQFLQAIDADTGEPIPSFGDDGRVDLRVGLDRDPAEDQRAIEHAGPRLRGPDHPRLGDQSGLRLGARRHPRLRRAHRQAGLDVSHRAASRRVRLRDVAAGCVEDRRRRERLGRALDRRAARHRLRADGQPQVQLLRRQPASARTCSAIACSRSTRAPASGSGTSRWCITTSGTTTTRPRRSC